jgi:hypothetical protein
VTGAGAIKVVAEGGPVAARSLTSNVSLAAPPGPLIPALNESAIVRGGEIARFEKLAHDPDRSAAVRTNLGLFSLSARTFRVRVEGFDTGYRPLGAFEGTLEPYRFTQIDDVLGRVRAPRIDGASVHVEALARDAAFLVYASVIRGADAPPSYLYASPRPDGRPTR